MNTTLRMNTSVLDFVVFLLNRYASTFGIPIREAYALFKRTQVLNGYIVKHYDVLHTQGEACLMEDLHELILLRTAQQNQQ